MPPSRLILTGIILAAAGVVAQVILGIVSARMMEGISSSVAAAGSLPGPEADKALDQIHHQTTLLFAGGWAAWIFVALGVIVFAAGTYRNALATETLQRQLPRG